MPRPPTHYQVLGLSRDASSVDIADAFRERLAALKAAPGGAPIEDEQAVRLAYQVLANPAARADYDAQLPSDKPRRPGQGSEPREPGAVQVVIDVIRETGALKFLVPLVLLVAIAIFVKLRQPAEEYPAARIVEVTRSEVQEAAPKPEQPESAAAAVVPEGAAEASPGRNATPMTAEEIFAAVSGSVARIQVSDASGKVFGQGSGVAVGNGILITNCHVVAGAAQISVKVAGKVAPANVLIADRVLDLCSLNVQGVFAPAVTLGSGEVRVGQRVYAIGAPQGLELTLSEGLVSSLRPTTRGAIIQTTAPVSPGSSGGGLFNAHGELVGIVTFQHRTGQNLNFAVPATWISEMKAREADESVSAPVARSAASPQ